MKLKDKTTADIVASWYRAWQPGPVPGSLAALRSAMLALDGPDLPEEIRAWQAAVEAQRQVIANRVAGQAALDGIDIWRVVEAGRALFHACAQGVTT